jgi:hypothetical protein
MADIGQPDDRSPGNEGEIVIGIEQRRRVVNIPSTNRTETPNPAAQPAAIAVNEKSSHLTITLRRAGRIISSPK